MTIGTRARFRPLIPCLLVSATVLSATAQEPELTPPSAAELSQAREQTAFTIGTQAYVYGLPMVNMYLKRQEHLQQAPLNQFRHLRDVVTPDMGIVSPNVDVLYSLAWLDLRAGPVVLTVPDANDRYFSFQLVDFFTDNGFYASSRTQAGKLRHFAYVGPDWRGKLPSGLQRFDCSSRAVGLIARTFVAGSADLAAARALQDRYRLTPLSQWPAAAGAPPPPPNYPRFETAEPLNFFAVLDEALRQNPPPPFENAPVGLLQEIGVGATSPFRVEALDPATRTGLTRALAAGQQIVATRAKQLPRSVGGWVLAPAETGRYGTNYLLRAAVASVRLGINSPRECFYLAASVDQDNQPLQAANRYRLRFEKDQLPPAGAFWSLTMYQLPQRTLATNTLDRARLHSLNKQLRYGPDGSLEILFQKDSPGPDQQPNWLPAPEGQFRVVLRLYEPPVSVLADGWTPPAVRRLP